MRRNEKRNRQSIKTIFSPVVSLYEWLLILQKDIFD